MITEQHELLLRDFDVDYRIEIASNTGDLSGYALARFSSLDVGSRSDLGLGLLLVLDPAQDRVRLEVGQRLEGEMSDAFVAFIEERQMVPFFRAGRPADGILAATELIVSHLQDTDLSDIVGSKASAGGGAARPATLGAGYDGSIRTGPDVVAQKTARATLDAYLDAMRARNGNAALDLYTAKTRDMMSEWVVTAAQMDSIARTYARCKPEATRIETGGRRAVIRYPANDRSCAPWFLERDQDRWRLDLLTSQKTIRFGARNAWHFAPRPADEYAYAFADWRLDPQGFPHVQ